MKTWMKWLLIAGGCLAVLGLVIGGIGVRVAGRSLIRTAAVTMLAPEEETAVITEKGEPTEKESVPMEESLPREESPRREDMTPAEPEKKALQQITVPEGRGEIYELAEGDLPRDLEINWVAGEIKIEAWGGDTLQVAEICEKNLTAETQLQLQFDGRKLQLDYSDAPWLQKTMPRLRKDLLVRIPEKGIDRLEQILVNSVDSDVEISSLDLRLLEVETVGGSLRSKDLRAEEMEFQTVTGNMEMSFLTCPRTIEMNSVSGSMELWLPADSDFEVELDSVSGKLRTDIQPRNSSENEIELETVSGSLTIKTLEGTAPSI